MMSVRLVFIFCVIGLVACGCSKNLTCDEGPYTSAVRGPRIQAPGDLDNLEPLKEMPLPAASPQPPRPDASPCLDQPPVLATGE